MVNHIYKILLVLLLSLSFNCTSYRVIEEPEMIIAVEMDNECFITVYTTQRDIDFDPPCYKGLTELLDTMPYTNDYVLELR